jgi:hypothetical protein
VSVASAAMTSSLVGAQELLEGDVFSQYLGTAPQ